MASVVVLLKRRLWRCCSPRTLLMLVTAAWVYCFVWTVYSTQVDTANDRTSHRHFQRLSKDALKKTEKENSNDWGKTHRRRHGHQSGPVEDMPGQLFQQPVVLDQGSQEDHVEVTRKNSGGTEKKIIRPGFRFDPPLLGEFGKPAKIELELLSAEERSKYDVGWKNHEYNEYISMQISTQRQTPDFTSYECKDVKYDLSKLPKVSIIICFFNEAWSVLLRTIHSVLNRSPPELVQEVILVDDFSTMVTMQDPLEEYVAQTDKLRLLRMTKRSGLVGARHAGVRQARSAVILFLDSHVECEEGWLPPLLKTLVDHPKSAVTPEIDIIDPQTFEIIPAIDNVGILEFETFSFNWKPILPRLQEKRTSNADLIESPTMAGGLFSIYKDYFLKLGGYDAGFKLWGGENIELSLKLWMCGGSINIHPCSRVAHIFRDKSPYLRSNVLEKNSARVAQVWADEYRDVYFKGRPYNEAIYGDVSERIELKKRLKCRSFGWYLDNILPELHVEGTGRYEGKMESLAGGCIDKIGLINCKYAMHWELTKDQQIRSKSLCLAVETAMTIVLLPCERIKTRFQYRPDKSIYHPASMSCLTVTPDPMTTKPIVTLGLCQGLDIQKWKWPHNPTHIIHSSLEEVSDSSV